MLRETALIGRRLGFKSTVAESTNKFTYKAFLGTYKKCKIWNEIVYKDHTNSKGEKLFVSLEGSVVLIEAYF